MTLAAVLLAASCAFGQGPAPADIPAPNAQAIALAFSSTFFHEVQVSTMGAVVDLSRLSYRGFYKLELIELLLLSSRAKKPFPALAERRAKGEALRALAVSHGVDYDRLYDAAVAVEEIVDRDYLPRFKRRQLRKEIVE